MLALLLWICLTLLAFTYVGYPLVIWLRARLAPRPPGYLEAHWEPRVDVLLVVHNGAAMLRRKLDNLLALDYPPDLLRIHVACDGCDDNSVSLARAHGDPRIQVHAFAARRGKSACLGDVLAHLDAEVVLFCDLRQRIDTGALRALLRILVDVRVGAVSGALVFEPADDRGFARSVDAYWRYERFVREQEAISGSVTGASGALYAARRALIPPIPPGLILDDLWIPLAVAAGGARVGFASDALAFDHASADPAIEAARKRRTLAGNFQLIARDPGLLLPWRHPLAWRLWGHKWLRLAAPWLMALALLANLVLAVDSRHYLLLALAQLAFYALAALAWRVPTLARWRPAQIAATFVRMNGYAALGLLDFLRGAAATTWQPTTNPAPPHE